MCAMNVCMRWQTMSGSSINVGNKVMVIPIFQGLRYRTSSIDQERFLLHFVAASMSLLSTCCDETDVLDDQTT